MAGYYQRCLFSFSCLRISCSHSALRLDKAPNRFYICGRLGSQASKARAIRRDKLLRPTDQTKRHGRGLETRKEAKGRRPGPAGGSRETPAAAAAESSIQRTP